MIFFFNDTATTEIYTLSLHDALPISRLPAGPGSPTGRAEPACCRAASSSGGGTRFRFAILRRRRSEEHTSELQSQSNLVCRLLLEKKKQTALSSIQLIQASAVLYLTE